MPESTTIPATATEVPQKLCEKCRHTFPPNNLPPSWQAWSVSAGAALLSWVIA